MTMNVRLFTVMLALTVATGALTATQAAQVTPAVAPAQAACANCHGAGGEGKQSLGAPRIAGQDAAYLARQLLNFKSGKRGYHPDDKNGAGMRAIASSLSDADIQVFAAQYAKMNVGSSLTPGADAAVGKELYLSTCSECHGTHAQGYTQLQSPNLKILGDWYIAAQMAAYLKGWRGTAEGSDLPTLWMRSIASHIGSPKELAAVIRYIGNMPSAAGR